MNNIPNKAKVALATTCIERLTFRGRYNEYIQLIVVILLILNRYRPLCLQQLFNYCIFLSNENVALQQQKILNVSSCKFYEKLTEILDVK